MVSGPVPERVTTSCDRVDPGLIFSVHDVLGNVEEVTRSGVDGCGAAGAELDPNGAVDDVHGGVVVAVVVPAGRHPGVTAHQPRPEAVDVDGLLAHLARCRVS